ncbi:hypothetical protein Mal64_20450 [Pseudobythopirellula maris]|uniref:Uncharacterized protein n=1 Tax=Pseudobythopirellula maris TaxID=2527991 RepID=A0A5C5ZP70_9BACT|nr:hypothetical protein [Pseudobythopirellula maris]TWT88561.1 hypothetical protein Mal64_20450 [Pseudobythopirellula maris]
MTFAVAISAIYWTATASVPEYDQIIEREPEAVEQDLQQFESQLAALYSDAQKRPDWSTVVTAGQINAWLARRWTNDYPRLKAAGVDDPRVLIRGEDVTLAFRVDRSWIDAVATIGVRPFLSDEGELGVEMLNAHVGRAAMPLARLAALLEDALMRYQLPVRWAQTDGHPTLLVNVPLVASDDDQQRRLEALELRDGEIYLSGSTVDSNAEPDDAASDDIESDDAASGDATESGPSAE